MAETALITAGVTAIVAALSEYGKEQIFASMTANPTDYLRHKFSDSAKTTIVMLGWGGALMKHLEKFEEQYSSLGVNIVLYTPSMSPTMDIGYYGSLGAGVVNVLYEHFSVMSPAARAEHNLVFHIFSNTGFMALQSVEFILSDPRFSFIQEMYRARLIDCTVGHGGLKVRTERIKRANVLMAVRGTLDSCIKRIPKKAKQTTTAASPSKIPEEMQPMVSATPSASSSSLSAPSYLPPKSVERIPGFIHNYIDPEHIYSQVWKPWVFIAQSVGLSLVAVSCVTKSNTYVHPIWTPVCTLGFMNLFIKFLLERLRRAITGAPYTPCTEKYANGGEAVYRKELAKCAAWPMTLGGSDVPSKEQQEKFIEAARLPKPFDVMADEFTSSGGAPNGWFLPLYNRTTTDATAVPAPHELYLYSATDALIDPVSVEAVIASRALDEDTFTSTDADSQPCPRANTPPAGPSSARVVQGVRFEHAVHVALMRTHTEEYMGAVSEFLQKILPQGAVGKYEQPSGK